MAPNLSTPPPEPSALTNFIRSSAQSSSHNPHYLNLAIQVQHDLQYQHEWCSLVVHTQSSQANASEAALLPRPLISGLPPRHVYIHPDDQVEMLKQGINDKDVAVEREWVLPTHVREKWSLRKFAELFDAIEAVPPDAEEDRHDERKPKPPWRRECREKRLLMAVVNDDSTTVYYIVHDGIVKPRQN